jgi:hypothetical protein
MMNWNGCLTNLSVSGLYKYNVERLDELKIIGKEAIVTYLGYHPGVFVEELMKAT